MSEATRSQRWWNDWSVDCTPWCGVSGWGGAEAEPPWVLGATGGQDGLEPLLAVLLDPGQEPVESPGDFLVTSGGLLEAPVEVGVQRSE
ncbi:hypothetical protein ACWCZ5_32590, partial [Streptomyces sp. NPDC001667]